MRIAKLCLVLLVTTVSNSSATERATLVAALEVAEATWNRAAVSEYSYSFHYSAMFRYVGCEDGFNVTIAGLEPPGCESLSGEFGSVPALFTYIRQALAENPDTLEVKFNSLLGYPERFEVDYRKDTSDDFFIFTVSNLNVTKQNVPPNNSLERTRGR